MQELVNEHPNSLASLQDTIREEIVVYIRKLSLYLTLVDKLMAACNNLRTPENTVAD
jgi:hypothetical protein